MTKLSVADGQLRHSSRSLGPATALFTSERAISGRGIVYVQLPGRMDYVFALGHEDGAAVVGIESKQVSDLISSWLCRRLQRQLRAIARYTDISCLLVRGASDWRPLDDYPRLQQDLLKWQLLGGYVLFGPRANRSLYDFLAETKAVLKGERNLKTILAGEDKPRLKGSPKARALQAMLRGVGPKTAEKLLAAFGSLVGVLQATEAELRAAGANKRVVASRARLIQ